MDFVAASFVQVWSDCSVAGVLVHVLVTKMDIRVTSESAVRVAAYSKAFVT